MQSRVTEPGNKHANGSLRACWNALELTKKLLIPLINLRLSPQKHGALISPLLSKIFQTRPGVQGGKIVVVHADYYPLRHLAPLVSQTVVSCWLPRLMETLALTRVCYMDDRLGST